MDFLNVVFGGLKYVRSPAFNLTSNSDKIPLTFNPIIQNRVDTYNFLKEKTHFFPLPTPSSGVHMRK